MQDGATFLRFEEGQLQLDTGYVMHFVDSQHVGLPVYDIISLPDSPCYPVAQTALNSLPPWARAKLEEQGHLKCSAFYDQKTKKFSSVALGWEDRPENPADVLAKILEEYDGDRLARSVYYYLYNHASSRYSNTEAIAELRDIRESSVENEIRRADEQLDIP
jgi:hypothetical protein